MLKGELDYEFESEPKKLEIKKSFEFDKPDYNYKPIFSETKVDTDIFGTEKFSLDKTTNVISGLHRFEVLYSPEYNKMVYILGEEHMKPDCGYNAKSADNLFLNLINMGQNSGVFMDVFVEKDYNPLALDPLNFDRYERMEKKIVI